MFVILVLRDESLLRRTIRHGIGCHCWLDIRGRPSSSFGHILDQNMVAINGIP